MKSSLAYTENSIYSLLVHLYNGNMLIYFNIKTQYIFKCTVKLLENAFITEPH